MTDEQATSAATGPTPYRAAPPAPPAPRRRRSRWLTVGLPLGLLLLAGIVTALVLGLRSIQDEVVPAQRAADDYASALVEGRWADAQAQLCARDRTTVSAEDLAAQWSSPPLTGHRLDGVSVRSVNGARSGEALLTFTATEGVDTSTVLPLADEDGTWRPCP